MSFAAAPPRLPQPDRNEVEAWDRLATETAQAAGLGSAPNVESRIYAMASLAVHDALNAIDRRYRSYALRLRGLPDASADAAIATAAHQVLVDQLGRTISTLGTVSQQAQLDSAYAASLAKIPDGAAKSEGVYIGSAAASAISAVRENDGSAGQVYLDFAYVQGTRPGEYRFTEGTPFAFGPHWGDVRPFALRDGSQFRPAPPYNVSGRRYALDLNEVKSLGGNGTTTSSARTADQTQIALFWYESSNVMWNRIARIFTASENMDVWRTARLLALVNVALTDGYISSFNAKYYYKFWRPESAIRNADTDGNPDTTGDATWTPLVSPTVPVPDHDSAHSVAGGDASQVLRRVLGSDQVSFATCSLSLPSGQTCTDPGAVYRTFDTLTEAMDENALSRILVGIHFRHATSEGIKHGVKVGDWTVDHILRPVRGYSYAEDEKPDMQQ